MSAEPVSQSDAVSQSETVTENLRVKGLFPFRIGTTSYVIPAGILPNLRYLQPRVDDVELVLFESDEVSNLPSPQEVHEMARLGRAADLSYTVHLPLDIHLGSRDEAERLASVGKCRRVFERLLPAQPFAWILHLHGDRRGEPPTDDIPRWLEQNRRSLGELFDGNLEPRAVCVETLDYDIEHVATLVEEFDLSICLDIGHLLLYGREVVQHLDRWRDRTRVYHVHGVKPGGGDHLDLGFLPRGLLEDLAMRLTDITTVEKHVVTMEVFGRQDFERSAETVLERLAAWRK